MIADNAVIFKWSLYSIAVIFCMAIQGMFLHRIYIWGVIPFLYPVLAAVPATYEEPASATVFALGLGIVCDLLLPEAFPCFYTILFPVTGLAASLLSRLFPAGIFCSYIVSVTAFLLHGVLHCFLLWSQGGGGLTWKLGMFLTLREFLITVPVLAPLVTILFHAVAVRTHADEPRNW